MKKESLGIILPGNPECVQKPRVWIKILEVISKFVWIPTGIAAVITFCRAFSKNSSHLLILAFYLFVMAICLYILRLLWADGVRCPYCRHFRTMERISDDKTISSFDRNVSRRVHDSQSGIIFDSNGNSAVYTSNSSHKEYGTETTKTYTYNMRCKLCGCVNKVERMRITKRY